MNKHKYAKTINLVFTGNKVFVTYQTQGRVQPQTHPLRTPLTTVATQASVTTAFNTPVSGSEVSLGVDTWIARRCQIWKNIAKNKLFFKIFANFLWQYFLMPKICPF